MSTSSTHFTLKAAAQRLGVHEQTLRSWEKRGLIRMARLPGSGYRRVPAAEVERVEREMNSEPPARGVVIVPPKSDPASLAEAHRLAAEIRTTIAKQEMDEPGMNFDEWLASRRGRQWSE